MSIKSFIQYYFPFELRLIFSLIITISIIGFIFIIINNLFYQYPGFDYLPLRWVVLAPVILMVMCLALLVQEQSPRISFFTMTYASYFFTLFAFALMTTGMQYTPFPTIDSQLLRLDQLIGFNTLSLIQWSQGHPGIKKALELAYKFLNLEMLVIPLLLPWLYDKKRVYQLLTLMLIAFLLGAMFYYFFPTTAPASVLSSTYFLTDEKATALKFFQIHHYLPVTTGDGGMIAFPSFHVVWAILLTYSLWDKKWLFYPLALINVMVILATLFLGWHYLMDVFGSIILVIITMIISGKVLSLANTE